MSDKQKLRESLASILHSGLISMRGTACKDAGYIQAESDHLHNLPFCVARMRDDDIEHYYRVERPRYLTALRRIGGQANAYAPDYRSQWRTIARWLRAAEPCGV